MIYVPHLPILSTPTFLLYLLSHTHPSLQQELTPVQIYFQSWRDMVIYEEVVLAEEENITLGGTKGVLKTGC